MKAMDTSVEPSDGDAATAPAVIVLGDAATLTRGSDNDSSESKQTPYD